MASHLCSVIGGENLWLKVVYMGAVPTRLIWHICQVNTAWFIQLYQCGFVLKEGPGCGNYTMCAKRQLV